MTGLVRTYLNPRLLAILCLGYSSGLPLALVGSTLQAWLTEAKVNLVHIGALSLLGAPYTFKFLWASVMDHYHFWWGGKRKGWILASQFALACSLFWLAHIDPSTRLGLMASVALAVAFLSASQDIAISAYQTVLLAPKERGLGAAYYIFTFRLAILCSGGLALVFADYLGWKLTYEIMASLICITMCFTCAAPCPVEEVSTSSNFIQTLSASWRNLFQKEKIGTILLFIIFYKFGDALALQLMTNFLLNGLGFTLTEVGAAYKTVSVIAVILGGFVGGAMLLRLDLYKALLVFGLAQTFSNLLFVVLAVMGKTFWFMSLSLFIENFCSGLSTAALLAFLMSLCDHRYTAGQFALLSAIASLGRVFLGPVAGWMVNHLGWVQFYGWSFILCFPGIFILLLLKDKVAHYAQATADI